MAKLEIKLNGQMGLAPKHFGNSLYSSNDPQLKYVGANGQMASGVYFTERYNGYMSPLPNQYQTCYILDNDISYAATGGIKMVYSDSKDPTNIIFADDNSIYNASVTPTIPAVAGAFDFNDGFSTPVYERDYAFNDIVKSTFTSSSFINVHLVHMYDDYYTVTIEDISNDKIVVHLLERAANNSFSVLKTYDAYGSDSRSLSVAKIDDTHIGIAYENVGEKGIVQIIKVDVVANTISTASSLQFKDSSSNGLDNIRIIKLSSDKIVIALEFQTNGYLYLIKYDADYTLTLIQEYNFDVVSSDSFSVTELDDTHFIISYFDGLDAKTKSFEVNPSGTITNVTAITQATVDPEAQSSVAIDSTHFITAYTSTDGDGFISTYSTDGSTISLINTLEHDTSFSAEHSLVKISNTHYALAYRGVDGDGFIKIFSLNLSTYVITQVSVLEHDTADCTNNSLCVLDSTHLALAYTSTATDGLVKTFTLDGSYNITQTNSLSINTPSAGHSLVKIKSGVLVLAFQGTDSDGFIRTIAYDGSYVLSNINTLEHDTSFASFNSLATISESHIGLAYHNGTNGLIKVFALDVSNNISQVSSLTHEATSGAGTYNSLIHTWGNSFVLSYVGAGADGNIKVIKYDGAYTLSTSTTLDYNNATAHYHNSLVKLDDYLYANVARSNIGSGIYGYTWLFSIPYTATNLGTLTIDTEFNFSSSVKIDSTHYALSYNNVTESRLKTFELSSLYAITEESSILYDTTYSYAYEKSLTLIGSDKLGLVYTNDDSYVKTFSFNGSYVLSEIDSYKLDSNAGDIAIIDDGVSGLLIANLSYLAGESFGLITYLSYLPNYTFLYNGYSLAAELKDVTRSQFAGAPVYYYIHNNKLGRSSTLSLIGTDDYATNTTNLLLELTNSEGLYQLRSENPLFINTKNQYIYVIDKSAIHGINVSISGILTDVDGTFSADLIIFQSGVSIIDGQDHGEYIYLTMTEGDDDVDLLTPPTALSTSNVCYVYIWNKISGQQLQANKIELNGCKHAGKIWSMDNTVYLMTLNSANICEIRAMNGRDFSVLHELGGDNEFSLGKESVVVTDIGTIIATNKGNLFLLDKQKQLKKLGTFADNVNEEKPTLVVYGGGEGHKTSNNAQGLNDIVPHITIFYTNSSNVAVVKKFFLRNVGTMNNSYYGFTPTGGQQTWLDANIPDIQLKPNQGDVYTLVEFLPKMSTIKDVVVYCKPTALTDSTVIGTIKLYINQSSTPIYTHIVTAREASRGYLEMPINKSYVNSIQFEVEYNTDLILGENDLTLITAVVEYLPTVTKK
jgi:hypothetical protein